MAIRGLIFDFDGLIVDTEGPIFQAWQELYEAHGQQLPREEWGKIIGTAVGSFNPVSQLEQLVGRELDWEAIEPEREQRERQLILDQPVLPGVKETLQAARRSGLKIGLASSSPCAWVTGHLSRLGLIEYFDCIRASDDVALTKPDPELFLAALECLGLRPEEAIVFEDSPNGIRAARRAGIFTVAIPNSLTRELALEEANLQLETMAELALEALVKLAEGQRAAYQAGL